MTYQNPNDNLNPYPSLNKEPYAAADPNTATNPYAAPNPYAATTPYGTTPYDADPYAAAQNPGPRTNVLAIIALVLGIVVPVAGIVTGHIALSQIKRTHEAGHGMALAGTIIGYVLTGLTILGVIAYFVFIIAIFAAASANGSSYSY